MAMSPTSLAKLRPPGEVNDVDVTKRVSRPTGLPAGNVAGCRRHPADDRADGGVRPGSRYRGGGRLRAVAVGHSLTASNDYIGAGSGTVSIEVHDGDASRTIGATLAAAGVSRRKWCLKMPLPTTPSLGLSSLVSTPCTSR